MKKHKTIDSEELIGRLCDEVNGASDLRILSLSVHLYIEYFLNELIRLKFDDSKFIIDEKELGSFYNKCQMLRALGLFKNDKLLRNIKLITRIRNFYAHHLLISDQVPSENKDRIKQLVYFDLKGNEIDFDVPYEEDMDGLMLQLQVCGTSTINVLQEMVLKLEAIEISKP